MMVIVSLVILALMIVIFLNNLKNNKRNDSALKRRAVFNSAEMMTYARLKEVLPEANVLAHVAFDSLLTTKYLHTRRKYQKMFADFVLLDQSYKVIAIITLDDMHAMKRSRRYGYRNALLESAGYKLVHYTGVPELQQLRHDFLDDFFGVQHAAQDKVMNMGTSKSFNESKNNIRIFG